MNINKCFKVLTKYFYFLAAMLVISCSEEIYEEANEIYPDNIKKKSINFQEFKNNDAAYQVYERLVDGDKNSRTAHIDSLDFEVIFDAGLHLSYANLESYTFPIRRLFPNGLIENLVINKQTDNKYYAKLIKYNLTANEKQDLLNGHLHGIQNPIETEILGEISMDNQIQNGDCEPYTITVITACSQGVHHADNQSTWGGCTAATKPSIRVVTITPACDVSSGGGGGSGIGNTWGFNFGFGNGSNGYFGDPFSGGGGSGGSSGYVTPSFPNLFTPIQAYEQGITELVMDPNGYVTSPAENFYNGLTQEQKDWINAQSFEIQSGVYNYLVQNEFNQESRDYIQKYLSYSIINQSTTFIQYQNWFSPYTPGKEDIVAYDSNYWNNPSITFPQQTLPSYNTLQQNFPNLSITAQDLCTTIGGQILTLHNTIVGNGGNINTCAIRLSKALNDSGIIIPNIPGKTKAGINEGANTKYYFTFAKDINQWMIKTFGTNSNLGLGPLNNNHIRIYASHLSEYIDPENGNVLNPNNPLNNIQGIFSMISSNPQWSTGHCDILQSNNSCINNCHFEGPIQYIDIWKLD